MTSIRQEGQAARCGCKSERPKDSKQALASEAPLKAVSDSGTAVFKKDGVSFDKALPAQGMARELPNLLAWGQDVAQSASDVAKRAVDGGKILLDEAFEALGIGDDDKDLSSKANPAIQDGFGGQPGERSEVAGSKKDPVAGFNDKDYRDGSDAKAAQSSAADPAMETAKPQNPQLRGLPPRPENARGGKEFMDSIKSLKPGPERDRAILDEILKGNIPDNLRDLKEVSVIRKDKAGASRELTMHVMPDYLSIGSNEDNVRIPMTPAVAQAIADRTGTSLPTDRMVDDIHANADAKLNLAPFQWKPGNEHAKNMQSIDWYETHDQRIDGQLGSGDAASGIVSGHKKDLVIPNKEGRVAIYGGSWPGTGKRVQPYSNLHESTYEDYSHGARLVSQDVVIDGKTMKLQDVLADPNLAPLFTRFPPGPNGEPVGLHNRYPTP